MEDDNKEKQSDEIQVLESIYGDDWYVIDESRGQYGITISESAGRYITLEVKLPHDYPEAAPPMYDLSSPGISPQKRAQLDNELSDIYLQNIGEGVLYMWIEKLRNFLLDEVTESVDAGSLSALAPAAGCREVEAAQYSSDGEEDYDDTTDWSLVAQGGDTITAQDTTSIQCPEIFHGEPLHDRKSKFQAHIAAVFYKEQVQMVLDKLCENKKIAAATHNIYSYRIFREEEGKRPLINQGCEDDGEIHAGNRMLHLMQIIDCQNVMVVVTRWYGGIHLGPDRFKHINSLTRKILEEHNYIKNTPKPKDKISPKKKKT